MKQLVTFFTLAYLISWVIWLPLYGPSLGIKGLPVVPFHHAIGGFGPLLAAIATTGIYNGRGQIYSLLRSCIIIKPVAYFLIALFSPFVLAIVAALISYFADGSPINLHGLTRSAEFPGYGLFSFFTYNLVFFGFGEEVGWRGFALPRLQKSLNPIWASLLLTLFWAAWHWPLFFYRPGYVNMGIAGISGWFFSLLTGSILLTWLYNSSKGSLLICAIFHATVDIAFTADMQGKNIVNYMGFLITVWGIATIFLLKRKPDITR